MVIDQWMTRWNGNPDGKMMISPEQFKGPLGVGPPKVPSWKLGMGHDGSFFFSIFCPKVDLQNWITWKSHENHMKITWKSHENHMKITWKSHENHMKITWKSHENHMKITWKSHENHMNISPDFFVPTWTPGWVEPYAGALKSEGQRLCACEGGSAAVCDAGIYWACPLTLEIFEVWWLYGYMDIWIFAYHESINSDLCVLQLWWLI